MLINNEFLEQAKAAKTAEEFRALVKAGHGELSAEKAEQIWARLRASNELSDDDLHDIAGGMISPR
ncbi:MAG: hypothetical protein PHP39_04610 [Oscillospiraceae bacterium]|nr:hypothetical protein [Oscillospiraceae bacterium]